tara:strand:- start:857 stop:1231 length:375 start_codon:yes stop_codon:yes gene_type:complete
MQPPNPIDDKTFHQNEKEDKLWLPWRRKEPNELIKNELQSAKAMRLKPIIRAKLPSSEGNWVLDEACIVTARRWEMNEDTGKFEFKQLINYPKRERWEQGWNNERGKSGKSGESGESRKRRERE